MTFSMALTIIKKGVRVTRTKYDNEVYFKLSETNKYMLIRSTSTSEQCKWIPTFEDLFAEDWKVYKEEE